MVSTSSQSYRARIARPVLNRCINGKVIAADPHSGVWVWRCTVRTYPYYSMREVRRGLNNGRILICIAPHLLQGNTYSLFRSLLGCERLLFRNANAIQKGTWELVIFWCLSIISTCRLKSATSVDKTTGPSIKVMIIQASKPCRSRLVRAGRTVRADFAVMYLHLACIAGSLELLNSARNQPILLITLFNWVSNGSYCSYLSTEM